MEKQEISRKFEDVVNSLGYLLIDVIFRGDSKLRIVEIYVDNEAGINSTDCSIISKELDNLIEGENLIESNYRLDVSSPGVDRPLKYLIQYKKHLNRKFEVQHLINGELQKLNGTLTNIVDDQLFFLDKKNEVKINFGDIKKAKVLISF